MACLETTILWYGFFYFSAAAATMALAAAAVRTIAAAVTTWEHFGPYCCFAVAATAMDAAAVARMKSRTAF